MQVIEMKSTLKANNSRYASLSSQVNELDHRLQANERGLRHQKQAAMHGVTNSGGNADNGLAIKWAWAFVQHVSLLLRQGS